MTIAYWCIFVFFLLGWSLTLPAKILAGDIVQSNHNPRLKLQASEGLAKAFYNAHLNSMEMFAPFAISVIIAQIIGNISQTTIDYLAIAFLVTRVFYVIAYTKDWPAVRTTIWWIGGLITLSFYVLSA